SRICRFVIDRFHSFQTFLQNLHEFVSNHASYLLSQYSSGNKIVVVERSASVIIQNLVPFRSRYAPRIRPPFCTASSFICLSSSSSSPQSPSIYRNKACWTSVVLSVERAP